MRALVIALFTISISFAQQQYRLVSLTGSNVYRFATATHLSDNGSAIGTVQANNQPVVFSAEFGVVAPPSVIEIKGINASGDIVGTTNFVQPFVARPPYDSLIDLSTVFDWILGSAVAINDRGDIVAAGYPADGGGLPYTFETWFPGLNVSYASAINNAGQVIGLAFGSTTQAFLYSPGKGVTVLPTEPSVLNNKGDMLFGPAGAQYIQTASSQIPLPADYFWVSINDSNEAVGYGLTTDTPVYFSVATGLIDLSTRTVNPGDYLEFRPDAINNRGQIAVDYTYSLNPNIAPFQGVGLLVPVAAAATEAAVEPAAQVSGERSVLRLSGGSGRRAYGVNGVPVGTVK